jgi:aminoglycoside phosphotransferase (APT) family kinase protein
MNFTEEQSPNGQIADRLTAFCRFHTSDPRALVSDVAALPGHAGLSFRFLLEYRADGEVKQESLVIRLAPAGVRPAGPADVARQGRIMASLRGSGIPVPPVRWFGDDRRWFGGPYYVAGFVAGRGSVKGDQALNPGNAVSCARAALSVMAKLHAADWRAVRAVWGDPVTVSAELARWDGLLRRPTLEPALVSAGAPLSRRLWASLAEAGPIGCIHGDFQWTNLLFAGQHVVAVLDWELAAIGPTLLDLGWLCLFCDASSWNTDLLVPSATPQPSQILALYEEITGRRLEAPLANRLRALAAYRFGVITIFNLMLHRRGKRVDPAWETLALSVPRMFERALELCS